MREFIVEADGGSRGNPGPAGYGAVVLDAAGGETLAEAAEYLGVVTNNVAEYRGLVAGLRAARALDPEARVHVRMDSKLVVEQMSGRWQIKHPAMRPLAEEARAVFPAGRVTYEWIPRAQNKHADRLANEAMDAGARGEQWSAADSTAELRVGGGRAGSVGAGELTEPGGAGERAESAERIAKDAERTVKGAEGTAKGGERTVMKGAERTVMKDAADVRAARNVAAAGGSSAASVSAPSVGWAAPPDLGAPATFVLLRHGETPLTPQKRFSGSGGTDPSLSAVGRDQAERAAKAFAERGTVQAVVASPLARTRETAAIVAGRLGLDVVIEEGLRETDFGAWEGLTFAEARERYPADLDAWLASPEVAPTGGGESFTEVAARVEEARERLVATYAGRTVLLVTHVTPIKTLVQLALGAPPKSLFRMELSAASVSTVAYYADGNASVRLFNETSHLR